MQLPEIDIIGRPYGKGSMIPMVSRSTGRAIMRPVQDFELSRWSGKITSAAVDVWRMPAITEPVVVALAFRTPRASRDYHAKDLDKLVRTVLDALTQAKVYKDDVLVSCLLTCKYVVNAAEPLPGVRINVATLGETRALFESFYARLPQAFNVYGASLELGV